MKKRNRNYPVKEYSFVLTYDSEDKVYIAKSIDLKGCHSDGKTPEEAIANIYEAMEGWMETARKNKIPIPAPSKAMSKLKKFLLRIEPENAVKLERISAAKHESVNSLINKAIAAL